MPARLALVLGQGAGGGVAAPDLVVVTETALAAGVTVALVEQPDGRFAWPTLPARVHLCEAFFELGGDAPIPRSAELPASEGEVLDGLRVQCVVDRDS